MIVGYWIVAMLPCMLILGLSTLKSRRAVRAQRWLVRNVAKYGPIGVRLLFLVVRSRWSRTRSSTAVVGGNSGTWRMRAL